MINLAYRLSASWAVPELGINLEWLPLAARACCSIYSIVPPTRICPIRLSFVLVAQIEMQNLILFGHLMLVDLQIKRLAEFPKDISYTLSSLEYIGFSGINTTGGAKYGYLNVWKDNTLLVFFLHWKKQRRQRGWTKGSTRNIKEGLTGVAQALSGLCLSSPPCAVLRHRPVLQHYRSSQTTQNMLIVSICLKEGERYSTYPLCTLEWTGLCPEEINSLAENWAVFKNVAVSRLMGNTGHVCIPCTCPLNDNVQSSLCICSLDS